MEQEYAVPLQVGPTVKTRVDCVSTRMSADLQHSWPVQSLLWVHNFWQVEEHRPLQQIRPAEELQSADVVQVWGQGSYDGLRHRPDAERLGSRLRTEVQQISPLVVLHVVESEQAFGHSEGGRQMG